MRSPSDHMAHQKYNKPYCRTMKSVQKQLAREVAVQSPKEAIRMVFTTKGGTEKAHKARDLCL